MNYCTQISKSAYNWKGKPGDYLGGTLFIYMPSEDGSEYKSSPTPKAKGTQHGYSSASI